MKNKKQASIIIPFRCDSPDRLENMQCVVRFLMDSGVSDELIILENGPEKTGTAFENSPGIRYFFEKSEAGFHKTRMMNQGARLSKNPVLCFYDTDVLIPKEGLEEALLHINEHPFIIPYNGVCLDISGQKRAQALRDPGQTVVPFIAKDQWHTVNMEEVDVRWSNKAIGGVVLIKKALFLQYGGYNEHIRSWGAEDEEIVVRFAKCGFPPCKFDHYNLLHLDHARGPDSIRDNPYHYKNCEELDKIKRFSPQQLKKYIENKLKKPVLKADEPSVGKQEL